MDFSSPRRRRTPDTAVPMISVAFLLLIFFLITAQIAPIDPFGITPPLARSEQASEGDRTLYVSADGALSYQNRTGEEVFTLLKSQSRGLPLRLKADQSLNAQELAALIPRLQAAGVQSLVLVTVAR